MDHPHLDARNHDDATNHLYRSSWATDRPAIVRATAQFGRHIKLPPGGPRTKSSSSFPRGPDEVRTAIAPGTNSPGTAIPANPNPPSTQVAPNADPVSATFASDTDAIGAALTANADAVESTLNADAFDTNTLDADALDADALDATQHTLLSRLHAAHQEHHR
ncbi:MAG: hypothetical protein ACI90M_002108 [Candidatus Azotimanducaceae bacterium]